MSSVFGCDVGCDMLTQISHTRVGVHLTSKHTWHPNTLHRVCSHPTSQNEQSLSHIHMWTVVHIHRVHIHRDHRSHPQGLFTSNFTGTPQGLFTSTSTETLCYWSLLQKSPTKETYIHRDPALTSTGDVNFTSPVDVRQHPCLDVVNNIQHPCLDVGNIRVWMLFNIPCGCYWSLLQKSPTKETYIHRDPDLWKKHGVVCCHGCCLWHGCCLPTSKHGC